jgi:hypothetical protein
MKIFLFLCMFIAPLYCMVPKALDDIDSELTYIRMILSSLETSLEHFNHIKDYKKGMELFKNICIDYKTLNNHPIWITDMFDEPEEQEPPSDPEDD